MKKMEKKYIPLAQFFQNSTQPEVTLSYEAIENIMGQQLPNAAYLNLSWWKKTKPPLTHYLAWMDAEYSVIDVKLGREVTFSKLQQNSSNVEQNDEKRNTYIIRTLESDDARRFINLQEQVFAESKFEYFHSNEKHLTVQYVRKMLLEWRQTKKSTVLLCISNGEFAGYLSIDGHNTTRTSHVASIRVGVLEEYQRFGIGSALVKQAEKWCLAHGITRLEAQIVAPNEQTIALLEKFSYIAEGTRKEAFQWEDQFLDEIYYAKLLK